MVTDYFLFFSAQANVQELFKKIHEIGINVRRRKKEISSKQEWKKKLLGKHFTELWLTVTPRE